MVLLRHPPATSSSSSKHQYVACRGGSTHRCPLPLPSMVKHFSLSFLVFLTCRVEAVDVYPLTSQVGGGVHHQRILKCSKRAREHWLGAGPGGGHTLLECWEPWTSSSSDIRSKLASVNPARRLLFYYSPAPSCCMHACSCSGRTRHRACHPSGLMNLMEWEGSKQSRHDQTG